MLPPQRPPQPPSIQDWTPVPTDSFMCTSPSLCWLPFRKIRRWAGGLATAAQAPSGAVASSGVVNATKDRNSFLLQDWLLYSHGPHADRLCIPSAGGFASRS